MQAEAFVSAFTDLTRRLMRCVSTTSSTAELQYQPGNARYRWLDGTLGFWEGDFDAGQHRARYRAYAEAPGA